MFQVTELTVRTQPATITAIISSMSESTPNARLGSYVAFYETLSRQVPVLPEKTHKNPQ
jgi:hypothetical protein